MKKLTKKEKIQLMVSEIMQGDPVPIIFEPYDNETDCMGLWDRFSLGHTTELSSYPNSNDWSARRTEKNETVDDTLNIATVVSAESADRKEAMCECMVKSCLFATKGC